MDWVPTAAVIDPDHHKPPAHRGPANHLTRLSISNLGLNSIHVAQHFFDLCNGNTAFGMIGTEVPTVGGTQTIGRSSTHSVCTKRMDKLGWGG